MDLRELEVQGKLQVKIGRALLRHKLIMLGNVLLVAWLFATILMAIWFLAYAVAGETLVQVWGADLMGLTVPEFTALNASAMIAFKLAAALLLLCPGLALRLCGGAMET